MPSDLDHLMNRSHHSLSDSRLQVVADTRTSTLDSSVVAVEDAVGRSLGSVVQVGPPIQNGLRICCALRPYDGNLLGCGTPGNGSTQFRPFSISLGLDRHC